MKKIFIFLMTGIFLSFLNMAKATIWHSTETSSNKYLVVTVNEYINDIHEFVEWKRIQGKKVFICAKNRGTWTTESVKDSIESYFQQYGINYLLIIGGESDVPSINCSDYYYGLPVDPSKIPRIFRGRIPMRTNNDVRTALNKIITYERTPVMDTTFYKTGIHCATFIDEEHELYAPPPRPSTIVDADGYEDKCYVRISEEVRYHMMQNFNKVINYIYYADEEVDPTNWDCYTYSNGIAIPQDLLRDNCYWDGYIDDIWVALDDGAHYIFYNGSGKIEQWDSPLYKISTINSQHNDSKLPIVFSMADKTGMFQVADSLICMAEAFLKKENGGSVAVIAPTMSILPGNSGAVSLGIIDAIWPNMQLQYGIFNLDAIEYADPEIQEDPVLGEIYIEHRYVPPFSFGPTHSPIYEIGRILDQSLCLLTSATTLEYGLPNEWLSFHCFGDPSMRFITEKPNYFQEPTIFSRNDSIFIFIEDGDCQISFYNKVTKEVKSYEGNYASYANPSDDLVICLDKHNHVPYIWDYAKDVYIQNENITNETRVYRGNIIHIGNHVTETKPVGGVNIQDSQITITGHGLDLQPGTHIDKNFIFQNL